MENFHQTWKNADICAIFKKDRPVSLLHTLFKAYEIIFYHQIYEYTNGIFSKYLCGFRRGHSALLLFAIHAWKTEKSFIWV